MQNLITTQQSEAVSNILVGKQNILLFTHLSPDGDAMGSSLGLYHWLLATRPEGVQVRIIVPNHFPAFLSWMPASEHILIMEDQMDECMAAAREADLVFCLDFNEPKRIGLAATALTAATCPKVMIDHHLNPDADMVDHIISYPEAPAASYLVLELVNTLGIPEIKVVDSSSEYTDHSEGSPKDEAIRCMASCLYTGLMTDTGNFAFNSNNPNLYEMIALLLRLGINKDQIYDSVFNQYSVDRLRFTGYCLYHKMRIFPKFHTALISLSAEELKRFKFRSGDAEGIVNMPLQIADVYYSCFMREDVDKIKLSFRSQGDRPVNEFAHEFFNGGGHMNAAGGESHLTLDQTVKLFEDNFRKYFTK